MAEKSVTIEEGAGLLLQQLADSPMDEWKLLVEQALLAAKASGIEETLIMLQLARSGYVGSWDISDITPRVQELLALYLNDIQELGGNLRHMRDSHAG
jgi:hypothetical protein